METFIWSTRACQYCGFWRPNTNSIIHKFLYYFYFCTVVTFVSVMCVPKLFSLVRTEMGSVGDFFVENYILGEVIGIYIFKGVFVYLQQSKIESVKAIFESDNCKPKNQAEAKIVAKYEKQCR